MMLRNRSLPSAMDMSRPLAALLLATLLLVTLAYQFDAAYGVDVGDYYDRVYLRGFHDRESVTGGDTFRWSTAEATVLLPGVGARGRWLALRLHGWRPAGLPNPAVRVSVNGHYLGAAATTSTWQEYLFWVPPQALAGGSARIVLQADAFVPAYLFSVGPEFAGELDQGQVSDGLLEQFRAQGRALAAPIRVEVNRAGSDWAVLAADSRYSLRSENQMLAVYASGGDSRSLGLAVSKVALLPAGGGGFSPGWPAWGQLGLALLLAILLYLGLAAVGLAPRWAALGTLGPIAALAWGLAGHRPWTTIYTARLAIAAGLGLLLVLLLRRLYPRLLAWARVEITAKELRLLLAIFLVGFLVKAAGLLYPYSVAVDLRLQLVWSSWIWDGRLAELYGVDSPLHEKTMPVEWGEGEDKPLIPYSPYWHITAASFFLLPWRPYDTANVVNVLLDVSKPLLLYLIARRLGLNRRTGMGAALLQALFPANLLVLSWGNAPTMMGLWWTYAATTYLVGAWERLNRPRTWAGLVFLLLGALLYYTVYALFIGLLMLILLVGMMFGKPRPIPTARRATPQPHSAERGMAGGRGSRAAGARSPLWAAALALGTAVALALLVYYGQFVGPILTRTIPHLLASSQEGGGLGKEVSTWSAYLGEHLVRLGSLGYSLLWPLLLALAGMLTGWKHAVESQEGRALRRGLLAAWLGTAFVFFLLGYRVDMVDKEIWFALPALALCAAVALEWLWRRGVAGRVIAAATYLYLAAAGLAFWILRLSSYLQDWYNTDAPVVGEVLRGMVAIVRFLGG